MADARLFSLSSTLVINNLQVPSPKIRPFWQKNRGPTEIILRICTRFSAFPGFFPLQAIAFQRQAPIQPLQKKSCLKHYRRFFGCSGMCHNRRMTVEMTGRNEGCAGWMAFCRPPGPMMKSGNPRRPYPSSRSHSSDWSHPSFLHALIKPPGHWPGSNPIKPNQTQSNPIKVKTGFQQGLIGPEGGPNRQFLPLLAGPGRIEGKADRCDHIRLNPSKSDQKQIIGAHEI